MEKLIRPARLAVMAIVTALLIAVSVVTLYKLQIVEGRAFYEESRNNIVTTKRVTAARGSIMDRYGRVLVQNRVCNNLIIDTVELFRDDDPDYVRANANILTLVNAVLDFGDSYTDTLPITKAPPFEFTNMTSIQRETLKAYMRERDIPENASAVEVLAYMRSRYKIDNSYTAEETRKIAGVRYEINSRYIHDFATSPYIFAEDVSMDLITTLMEQDVPGFEVQSGFVREYTTSYASHILGYVGMMSGAQVEKYTKLGYSNDAMVGQAGAESAFEEYLHGHDGKMRVTSTATGVVTNTVYIDDTVPGNHAYLTIDIGLQEAAENALSSYALLENEKRAEKNAEIETYGGDPQDIKQLITGAAAVVVDVAAGEPLAIASWPTYELTDFIDHYSEIMQAENDPMFNRALQGTYMPGSTFKPCTAIAALNERKIDTGTIIECEGRYTKYEEIGYAPKCWIYGQGLHGEMTVSSAITNSCNYFFYTVGDYLQISLMAKYAKRALRHRALRGDRRHDHRPVHAEEVRARRLRRRNHPGRHRPGRERLHAAAAGGILRCSGQLRPAPHRLGAQERPLLRLLEDPLRAGAHRPLRDRHEAGILGRGASGHARRRYRSQRRLLLPHLPRRALLRRRQDRHGADRREDQQRRVHLLRPL